MLEFKNIQESFLQEEIEIVKEAIIMNEADQAVTGNKKESNVKKIAKKLKEFFAKIIKAVKEAMSKFTTFFVAQFGKVTKFHDLAEAILAKIKKDKKEIADFVSANLEFKILTNKFADPDEYKRITELKGKIYSDQFEEDYSDISSRSTKETEEYIKIGSLDNAIDLLNQSEQLVKFSKDAAKSCKQLKAGIEKDSKIAIKEIKELEKGKEDRKEKINEQKQYVTRANKLFNLNRQASTHFLKQDYNLCGVIVNYGLKIKIVEQEYAKRATR